MTPDDFSWTIEDPESMRILIRYHGNTVMKISVHEVIESSSRKKVLSHVAECDRTHWLTRWQNEKREALHEELIDILKK